MIGRVEKTMLRGLLGDEGGSTALEYALLLAAIGIPLLQAFMMVLDWLVGQYQMETTLNSWPFP